MPVREYIDTVRSQKLAAKLEAYVVALEELAAVHLNGVVAFCAATDSNTEDPPADDKKYTPAYAKHCMDVAKDALELRERLVSMRAWSSTRVDR